MIEEERVYIIAVHIVQQGKNIFVLLCTIYENGFYILSHMQLEWNAPNL